MNYSISDLRKAVVAALGVMAFAASWAVQAQQAPSVSGSSFNINATADGIVNRSRQGELIDASGRFGWAGIGLSGSYSSLAQALVATTRNGVAQIRGGASVSGIRADINAVLSNSLNEGGQIGNGLLLIGD